MERLSDQRPQQPGISVVIPAYNEDKYLVDTILSVRVAASELVMKRRIHAEIIVVDDGSTDRTGEIAASWADHLVKGPRTGIGTARNVGSSVASGPLFAFIDADTIIEAGVLIAIYDCWRYGARVGAITPIYQSSSRAVNALLATWRWYSRRRRMTQGVCQFVDAELFDRIKGYSVELQMAEDTDFFRRAVREVRRAGISSGVAVINDPRVWPSMRRYDAWSPLKIWLWTNPITTRLFKRSRSFWHHWYSNPPR